VSPAAALAHRVANPYAPPVRLLAAATLALVLLPGAPARAWSDHAVATRLALANLRPPGARPRVVRAEPLAVFLGAERERVGAALAAHQAWARVALPEWPPLPAELAFDAAGRPGDALVQRFLGAIRANPTVPLPLFRQLQPGETPAEGAAVLAASQVMIVRPSADLPPVFVALAEGALVPALEVVATAADEPDHGLDVGLWSDNGTPWGGRYGLGPQPFGNPALEFASQAPFHMGLYFEPALAYRAAPELRRTFPEERIHLFRTLSALAFTTGHAYWGWRFAGFAIHYLQDLTQPWHARALPGVGFAGLLWRKALDAAGVHGPRARAVALASNRHVVVESWAAERLRAAVTAGRDDDALVAALRDASADDAWPVGDGAARDQIARAAHGAADALDAAAARGFPARWVADPAVTVDDTRERLDVLSALRAGAPGAEDRLARLVAERLRAEGAVTRNLVRALAPAAPP
jgi:hypothetical protein